MRKYENSIEMKMRKGAINSAQHSSSPATCYLTCLPAMSCTCLYAYYIKSYKKYEWGRKKFLRLLLAKMYRKLLHFTHSSIKGLHKFESHSLINDCNRQLLRLLIAAGLTKNIIFSLWCPKFSLRKSIQDDIDVLTWVLIFSLAINIILLTIKRLPDGKKQDDCTINT